MRRRLLAAMGLAALGGSSLLISAPARRAAAAPQEAGWRDLELPGLDGVQRTLVDGRSARIVIVNLWARWCAPCRRELPALQRLAAQLKAGDPALWTVALDDDPFALREYVRQAGLTLPVLWADSAALPPAIRPDRLPQTLLIDGAGQVQRRVVGARDWDTAAARRELLGAAV